MGFLNRYQNLKVISEGLGIILKGLGHPIPLKVGQVRVCRAELSSLHLKVGESFTHHICVMTYGRNP